MSPQPPDGLGTSDGRTDRRKTDRRRTEVDRLYDRMLVERETFWDVVYPLFMAREITKEQVREVIRRGLEESRGNYRILVRVFNLPPGDYKKFLNFLRQHGCHLPFRDFR